MPQVFGPSPCDGEVASYHLVTSCTGRRGRPQRSPPVLQGTHPCALQQRGLEEPTYLKDHNFAASLLRAWMCVMGGPPSVPHYLCWSGEGPVPFPQLWDSVTSMETWGWESDLTRCMSPKGRGRVVTARLLQPTTTLSHSSWFAQTVSEVKLQAVLPREKTKIHSLFFLLFSWKNQKKGNPRRKDKDTFHSWEQNMFLTVIQHDFHWMPGAEEGWDLLPTRPICPPLSKVMLRTSCRRRPKVFH